MATKIEVLLECDLGLPKCTHDDTVSTRRAALESIDSEGRTESVMVELEACDNCWGRVTDKLLVLFQQGRSIKPAEFVERKRRRAS